MAAAATRTRTGKFTPVFTWDSGETKYLQFLTSMDEIPTLLMHQFIIVGHREDGKPIYERFISRRDPAIDGPDGYDELIDRFEVQPKKKSIALAVELDPIWSTGSRKKITGVNVLTREYENKDGETIEVPNVALIIESPFTLFEQVLAIAEMGQEITESVYAVRRNGKGTDTSYTLQPVFEALDLDEDEALDEFFEEFDFENYLETLADEDRMKEIIGALDDDAVVQKSFGGKKDKSEDKKPSGSSRRRRAPEPDPEEQDEPEEADEPEAEADEKPAGRRSRRFSDLQANRSRK